MRWILWLLILMFVLLTLPTVEGAFNFKKAVSKTTSNANKAIVSAAKTTGKAIVGAANATAAFAVATTTGKTSNSSNKKPEETKIDPNALKCASPNDVGKWYTVKHVKEGRTAGIYDSKNEIRCDFNKYPPATKFNECVHSAAPNIPLRSLKKHVKSEITDNNLKSIYYLAHPNLLAGINDNCKWIYWKHKKGLNLNDIISNTLVEDIV